MTGTAPRTRFDGRLERSRDTRERLERTTRMLLREGIFRPPEADIAKIAGVSKRTIYNQYGRIDELYLAALDEETLRYLALDLRLLTDESLIRAFVLGRLPCCPRCGSRLNTRDRCGECDAERETAPQQDEIAAKQAA